MATNSNDHNFLQTVPRPVATMATSYPAGYVSSLRAHPRAQLLYAASGCMKITIDTGYWIIPPQRAVWLPPEYPHRTGTIGPVQMRILYIREDACSSEAPSVPRMVGVSALLRELILRAAHMPVDYDEQGQDARIIGALLGEIDWTALHPISLPMLRDARLQKMEEMLIRTPNDRHTLDQWAERMEISPRTLTRLLRREVHLSFQAWRDQIRTFTALPLIAEGRPLTEVADAVGYGTPWSFTAMFKRVTGKVPSRYFSAKINA